MTPYRVAVLVVAAKWSVDFTAAGNVDVNREIMENNIAEICVLLEEEEEEEIMLLQETVRNSPNDFLLERGAEGCYDILIKSRECQEEIIL